MAQALPLWNPPSKPFQQMGQPMVEDSLALCNRPQSSRHSPLPQKHLLDGTSHEGVDLH